jgi:N-methylhydantoinase A
VHFDDCGFTATAIYRRQSLRAGGVIDGPAIIEQADTTIVIHPRQRAKVRADRSILIEVMHAS